MRTYQTQLLAFLRTLGYVDGPDGALAAFRALPVEQQTKFLLGVYFAELNQSGLDYNDPASRFFHSYLEGTEAIRTLFPATDLSGQSPPVGGNLTLGGAGAINTLFGGALTTVVPYGSTTLGAYNANPPAKAGLLTEGSGNIDIYSYGSIILGESRVLTTFGGDILIWLSSDGQLNAGRGSKSTVLSAPIGISYDTLGNVTLSPTVPSSGARHRHHLADPAGACRQRQSHRPRGHDRRRRGRYSRIRQRQPRGTDPAEREQHPGARQDCRRAWVRGPECRSPGGRFLLRGRRHAGQPVSGHAAAAASIRDRGGGDHWRGARRGRPASPACPPGTRRLQQLRRQQRRSIARRRPAAGSLEQPAPGRRWRRVVLAAETTDFAATVTSFCSSSGDTVVAHRSGTACAAVALILLAAAAPMPDAPVTFDIPAEPLEQALDAYGNAAGIEVVYDTALAVGRRSGAVHGRLSDAAAIGRLLAPTDLAAIFGKQGTMTITPRPEAKAATPAPVAVAAGPSGPFRPFLGRVQSALRAALCRNSLTRPGAWRAELLVWIGASGQISRAVLRVPSGEAARDRALMALLPGITVGSVPADFPQPVTVTVSRPQLSAPAECEPP